jgi:hypothetical protein
MTTTDSGGADRDQFIPVRKEDILDALIEHGPLANEAERAQFRQICRMLAAIYHYEYFAELERLRHAYYYFNPELDPHAHFEPQELDRAYEKLLGALQTVLKGANFVEMSHAEVEAAHRELRSRRRSTTIATSASSGAATTSKPSRSAAGSGSPSAATR